MPWNFKPSDNLKKLPNSAGMTMPRMCETSLTEKVEDAFRVLGGSAFLTIKANHIRSFSRSFEIARDTGYKDDLHMGVLDYSPLMLSKLLQYGALKLHEYSEKKLHHGSHLYWMQSNALPLIALTAVLVQFVLTVLFTAISFPVIFAVHVYSLYQKSKIEAERQAAEKAFPEKYDAQLFPEVAQAIKLEAAFDVDPLAQVNIQANAQAANQIETYKIGPMKNIRAALNSGVEVKDAVEVRRKYNRSKLLLFSVPAGHQLPNGKPAYNQFFYKFNYSPAGKEAFDTFRQFSNHVCAYPANNAAKEQDKGVTSMLMVYFTFAQMSRNSSQKLECKGKLRFRDAYSSQSWFNETVVEYDRSSNTYGHYERELSRDCFDLPHDVVLAIASAVYIEGFSSNDKVYILNNAKQSLDKMLEQRQSGPRVEEVVEDEFANAGYVRYTK